MLGDAGMIKLFRRLELGHNLDIEVHDALRRAGVHDVATLYGWVEAGWTHGGEPVRADLAMAVEKLAGAEDGWGLALDALRDGRSFEADARRLGQALAEIHAALRTAFPTAEQPGGAVATIMKTRLSVAADAAPALEPYVEALTALFDRLGHDQLPVQRVHGDFHLGQTLRTPSGWKIIDFEGEPAKTLAERVAPDSVWRDVAGMLRSFDYAAASLSGPDSAEWAAACRQAFPRGLRRRSAAGERRGPARAIRGGQGDLRSAVRGAEPTGLGGHPDGRRGRTGPQRINQLDAVR